MGEASRNTNLAFRAGILADYEGVSALADAGTGSGVLAQATWAGWVDSEDSFPVVALRGEHVIGAANVRKLGPAEYWAEGLYVAANLRGVGVEQVVMAGVVEQFKQNGEGFLRMLIRRSSAVLQQAAGVLRLRHVASYIHVVSTPEEAPFDALKLLQSRNHGMVWPYLRNSPSYRSNGYAESEHTLYFMTSDRLQWYLDDPAVEVAGWRNQNRLAGLAITMPYFGEDGEPIEGAPLHVTYINAPDDTTLTRILIALRGLAAFRGNDLVRWAMPMRIGLEGPVEMAGFVVPDSDDERMLYELPITATIQVPF